jgi:hypothetical protein
MIRGELAIMAMRQWPQSSFLRMLGFFIKNLWHFEDIYNEIEAFLKISILFEGIFREIQPLLN